jgi:hypothetical protein
MNSYLRRPKVMLIDGRFPTAGINIVVDARNVALSPVAHI